MRVMHTFQDAPEGWVWDTPLDSGTYPECAVAVGIRAHESLVLPEGCQRMCRCYLVEMKKGFEEL